MCESEEDAAMKKIMEKKEKGKKKEVETKRREDGDVPLLV